MKRRRVSALYIPSMELQQRLLLISWCFTLQGYAWACGDGNSPASIQSILFSLNHYSCPQQPLCYLFKCILWKAHPPLKKPPEQHELMTHREIYMRSYCGWPPKTYKNSKPEAGGDSLHHNHLLVDKNEIRTRSWIDTMQLKEQATKRDIALPSALPEIQYH